MTKQDPLEGTSSAAGQGVRDRTPHDASSGHRILLVDDNRQIAHAVTLAFDCAGHRVDTAVAPPEAFSLLAQHRYDAILLDLNFTQGQTSGEEGFACLARIVADDPTAAIVVITAHSGIRIAVAAMQAGASDFVMKPWRNADLIARVDAAIGKRRRPVATIPVSASSTDRASGLHRLLGDSPAMTGLRDLIRRVAPSPASVIVRGASGSGRSLVAAALHDGSPHADRDAVTVDVRDAAAWERIDAVGGTLILRHPERLDDIQQARLLDRLPATVRTVAIVDDTAGLSPRLRARLGTVELTVPRLIERQADALLLARHFAALAATRHGRAVPPFTASAEALILARHWPDEVRGLAQAIERAVLLDQDGVIDAAALAPRLVEAVSPAATATPPLDVSLEQSERVMIEAALRHHHHNVSHAAAALGLSRQALYRRMTRHGL